MRIMIAVLTGLLLQPPPSFLCTPIQWAGMGSCRSQHSHWTTESKVVQPDVSYSHPEQIWDETTGVTWHHKKPDHIKEIYRVSASFEERRRKSDQSKCLDAKCFLVSQKWRSIGFKKKKSLLKFCNYHENGLPNILARYLYAFLFCSILYHQWY